MSPKRRDLEPKRHHGGGFSVDGSDPKMVKALARRVLRPLRDRARHLGYALATHGSMERDIDLIAVPWTEAAVDAHALAAGLREKLSMMYAIGLEVLPGEGVPKPHGRLCWSWWIRPWTYIDLSVIPTGQSQDLET